MTISHPGQITQPLITIQSESVSIYAVIIDDVHTIPHPTTCLAMCNYAIVVVQACLNFFLWLYFVFHNSFLQLSAVSEENNCLATQWNVSLYTSQLE